MAAKLSTICMIEGFSKARVDKWISDGNFRAIDVENGLSREWGPQDLIRLLCFVQLVDAGCKVEVGRAIGRLHGFNDSGAYLVVEALKRNLRRPSELEDNSGLHESWRKVLKDRGDAERHVAHVCKASEVLQQFGKHGETLALFVLDLNEIEDEAKGILARAERMEASGRAGAEG